MDDEQAELVPIFVSEVRERLQRLAALLPALDFDPAASLELKRELHTLKGAGRMMAIEPFAELCHAAEELFLAHPVGASTLLAAAHDGLATLCDAVEREAPLVRDEALLLALSAATELSSGPPAVDTPATHSTASPLAAAAGAILETPLRDAHLDAFAERGVRVRAAGVSKIGRAHV